MFYNLEDVHVVWVLHAVLFLDMHCDESSREVERGEMRSTRCPNGVSLSCDSITWAGEIRLGQLSCPIVRSAHVSYPTLNDFTIVWLSPS